MKKRIMQIICVTFLICTAVCLLTGCYELHSDSYEDIMTGKILKPASVGFLDACSLSVDLQEGGKVSLLAMEEYEPVYGLQGQEFDAEAAWVYILTGTYTQKDDTLTLKLSVMRDRMLVRGEEAEEFRNAYIEYLRNEFLLLNAASLFSERGINDPDFDVLTEVKIDVSEDDWKWILSKSYNSDGSLYSECYYADNGNVFVDHYYDDGYLVNRTEYSPEGIKLSWTSFHEDGEVFFDYDYYEDGTLKIEWRHGEIYTVYDTDGTKIKHDTHNYVNGVCDFCGEIEPTYDEVLAFECYSDHCVLTGIGECPWSNIVVPAEHNGLPVTRIGDRAFYNCNDLISISIPDSVTSIGQEAFAYCSHLNAINFSENSQLIGIGSSTFYNCALTSITIPSSVTNIGVLAFGECFDLVSVTLPDSIEYIGESAFYMCTSLQNIYITDITAWLDIGFEDALSNPMSCASNLYINGELATEIAIPDGTTSIGNWVFFGCSCLTNVSIPDSVTSIGDSAFNKCIGLTCINIPSNVTSIGEYAFYSCTGLTSINIPSSVINIGECAFGACTDLISVTVEKGNNVYRSSGNCLIEDGYVILGCSTSIIPTDGSVYGIGWYAFYYCTGLKNITIPDDVHYISGRAFQGCTGLTSVTLPKNTDLIYQYAFANCSNLTSITIPDSVTMIDYCAFAACSSLTDIVYSGTMAQWNAIEKHSEWALDVSTRTVHCTDGDVSI